MFKLLSGFCSPYLKKMMEAFPFRLKTCVTRNEHIHCSKSSAGEIENSVFRVVAFSLTLGQGLLL